MTDLQQPTRDWATDFDHTSEDYAQVATDIVAARLPTVLIDPTDEYLLPGHPLSKCCRVSCDSVAVARRAAD